MGVWLQQITLPESENPHTEVVDCSKSSLQQITVPESENPTHGSVWNVQIQPTTDNSSRKRESHTRKCVDCSDPAYKDNTLRDRENPTHGSVWNVQIQAPEQMLPNAFKSDFNFIEPIYVYEPVGSAAS